MKNKIIITLILWAVFVFKVFGFNPKVIDTLKIHNQIKSLGFNDWATSFSSHFFSDIVFKNDSTLIYNPNSTLFLFEIRLGDATEVSLISKRKKERFGHNFNRHLFMHNNVLFSYGGEGLFNTFPGLIYFDFSSKEWVKKDIKNYPFDSRKVLNSWKIGNKIMVLLNHFSELRKNSFDKSAKFSFGEIDLENFEYERKYSFDGAYDELLFQSSLGFFRGNYIYDSDFYSLHGYYQDNNVVEYRLLDKKSGSLKRTAKLDALNNVNGLSYLYIKDSTIYYRNQNGIIESFDINSDTIIHSKEFFELYKFKSKNKLSSIHIIIIAIFVIALIFIKRIKGYSPKSSTKSSQKELLIIMNKLENEKPVTVSKEKLDDLLGISHYSYETIKTRRSSMIKELNSNTDIKIERVRNKIDKRYFDYKIS
jgi:hypothetical protein